MSSYRSIFVFLLVFAIGISLSSAYPTGDQPQTQTQTQSAPAQKNLTKKKRSKSKIVLFEPAAYEKAIVLITKGKEWKYYLFTQEKPLRVEVEGTAILTFRARLIYDVTMKGEQKFAITLEEQGMLGFKSDVVSYSFMAEKSTVTTIKGAPQLIPSTGHEFKFTVPDGKHTYLVSLRGTAAQSAAVRVLIPEKNLAPAKSGLLQKMNFRMGIDTRYDDNVFQYSGKNRKAFDPKLRKFAGLTSIDDFVLTANLRMDYRFRPETRVILSFVPKFYERNTVKNYQTYSARIEQQLPNDYEVNFRYLFVPNYFLLPLANPPNQSRTYAPAKFQRHSIQLALEKEITKRVAGELLGFYESKNYSAIFNELDSAVIGTSAGTRFRMGRSVQADIQAGYERSTADGKNNSTVNYDTSYREWTLSFAPATRIGNRVTAGVEFSYVDKRYTSSLPADKNHYERDDITRSQEVYLRAALAKRIDARIDFERIHRTSNREGVELEFANFTDNRVTSGIILQF